MRSEGALQRPITGTCVASVIVPTVPMRFAPSWARGEGAVTSLLRMLGTAATKALNGPVALVVLTARRGRIRVCRPREVRSGHGSRGYTRKNRMSNPESESLCSEFALGPQGKSPHSETQIPRGRKRVKSLVSLLYSKAVLSVFCVKHAVYGGRSRRTHILEDQLDRAGAGSWQIADRYYMAS